MTKQDELFFHAAISLARQAEAKGNLPIGAVIVLNDQIIARGMNTIWQPETDLTRHAEMEALRNLPFLLRSRCTEMSLFTTLEPCVMCAGAILLHRIGRLVYGSSDPYGGFSTCLHNLPPYFKGAFEEMKWEGPALAARCDAFYRRIQEVEQHHQRK